MNRQSAGDVPTLREYSALTLPWPDSIDLRTVSRPRRNASSEPVERLDFVSYLPLLARSRSSEFSPRFNSLPSKMGDSPSGHVKYSRIFLLRKLEVSLELPFCGSFRLLHALPKVEGRY